MDPESVNRVEAYFRDELSEHEISQFRKDLTHDEELKQLFQEYQLAMEAVDVQVEAELNDQFKEWRSEKTEHESKQRSIFPQVWKIAASFALLATVAYLIFRAWNNQATGYELAQEYYVLPESPGSDKGKGEESWAEGLRAYESGDFQQAVALWSNMDNMTPEQEYYLAHAYFKIENYSEAETHFQNIAQGTSAYGFSADWFLALCYLANDQLTEFDNQINKITQTPGHPYADDASRLSEKVRSASLDKEK